MSKAAADLLVRKRRAQEAYANNPDLELAGVFLVEMSTPSENQVQSWLRKQPHRYTKLKNSIYEWVMVASMNAEIPKATGRRLLNIIRSYKSERYRLDDDNFIAGCKSLRDACSHYGIIVDDDDKNATFSYQQVKQTDGGDWVEIGVFDYA